MARVYATAEQYETYTGAAAPADIDHRLLRASTFLDAQVFRMCRYDVTDAGLPSNELVAAAFADAVCAQAQWGVEVGDTTGAAGVGWGNVKIGSVQLGRSVTSVSGADAPGRQVAPAVGDALRAPDLTPDILQLGAVSTW
ncbi:hypothetical protein [Streptomyces erythrochromogenes]|uniref:hypothetical protein n=1 Tax=Streptomyces erythrochromogenes TaxID=285574 RepID=UPI002251D7D2|nr:hypothetical protein [Streptomyces erythrochromogenes]MCX5587545.1 hypothetical protein [Streptomyces erythrochromogenes]